MIGGAHLLIAVGAILRFAVTAHLAGISIHTVTGRPLDAGVGRRSISSGTRGIAVAYDAAHPARASWPQ
jgi:hypothetical protein